mmetsp:Transcript_14612/g.30275  ORF Transcript_14612/g.30275 Transcript_14612/m.30275 type:complete len:216 (+) Transcript_14612:2113-2760(+)|eukprot:CAMPEP_0201137724 /NCGR_PEP_ID=MMETSP0850-20130426/55559_1 /ASSEMBLY_ACC=CAM_ASM_000622 /TAXON_ID=183588 /ORGANISM="Pseudo-nitzschia fraudulenta, Strain WWA7" /LENGTH=215 /DNA_ID=CAMNT_0047409091 /DNA_START=1335 /DNA_END=1982 /DNA_ORIENTATION=-
MSASSYESTNDNSGMNTEDRRNKLRRTHSPASVVLEAMALANKIESTKISHCVETDWNEDNSETKSVGFSQSVKVRLVRSHSEYTIEQKKACWYEQWEMKEIRSNCVRQIKIARNKLSSTNSNEDGDHQADCCDDDDDIVCLRGLESYLPLANKQKLRNRREASDMVFDVEDEGGDDVEIARCYSSVTSRSQIWANVVGLRDARDAESVYNESSN